MSVRRAPSRADKLEPRGSGWGWTRRKEKEILIFIYFFLFYVSMDIFLTILSLVYFSMELGETSFSIR